MMYGDQFRYIRERAGYSRYALVRFVDQRPEDRRSPYFFWNLETCDEPVPERWVKILETFVGTKVFQKLSEEFERMQHTTDDDALESPESAPDTTSSAARSDDRASLVSADPGPVPSSDLIPPSQTGLGSDGTTLRTSS